MDPRYRLACRTRVYSDWGRIRCRTLRRSPIRIEESGVDYSGVQPGRKEVSQQKLPCPQFIPLSEAGLGLALDLGTTTVVIRLVGLDSGRTLASHAFENPQRFAGSDVMSRIHFDGRDPDHRLKRVLIGYINHSIRSFPVDPWRILEITVAGNTTMRDLFFGLDVGGLGRLPFRSVTESDWTQGKRPGTSVEVRSRELGLLANPEARVYGLPLIGSHVGADTAACILATGYLEPGDTTLLMDIGTNTELVIRSGDRILAASCPAGPAFEGGFVKCGMPALEGAIEKVRIKDDLTVETDLIGSGPPAGICGSGLVSILGELSRIGAINERGRLNDRLDRFLVDPQHSIFLDEQDISNLAQAKAANSAGLRILLRQLGIGWDRISRVYLAGAFARHLDLDAARRIGLIPPIPDDRILRIGNASIEGATATLLSTSARRKLERFVTTVRHIELETDPRFFDFFVDGCLFRPFDA